MSVHKDHRQRLKDRFQKEGLDDFDELYVLELLLFYCIPRVDTNPIAHRLLNHFGSLSGVFSAKSDELEMIEGIGPNASLFLSLIPQLVRYCQVRDSGQGKILRSIEQCGEYLVPYFFGREQETVFLLCLDARRKVLCCKMVGEGSVNSANIPVRKVVQMALDANATSVVLAHNHPSGLAIPSAEDIQTTHRIANALQMVDVILADHIVVSKGDYVSIVQSKYYKPECL